MGWEDAARIESEFGNALTGFDWTRVDELCGALVGRLRAETDRFPEDRAERILRRLRSKRRFRQMASLAEAFTESGLSSAGIGVSYAQALIERGYLTAAERLLQSDGTAADDAEKNGLKGRIAKQRYVKGGGPRNPRYRSYLERAIAHYLQAYQEDPGRYWHGINVVALTCRARRDGVALGAIPVPEPKELARSIAGRFAAQTEDEWELATRLEAQLALGDERAAEAAALDYAGSRADAFEVASTLRQLVEVWGLVDDAPPGSRILPILRAALLRQEGGGIRMDAQQAWADLGKDFTSPHLEKVFGTDRFNTLEWYQMGLKRCRSIARIETRGGAGRGTGWLFKASDMFANRGGDELLMMTNAHVIPALLSVEQAIARFQMSGTTHEVHEILWSSPVAELDATVVKLKSTPPEAEGLPLSGTPIAMAEPPPRLYVIGHPGGRDLEFSLQDNVMLGCNDRRVHYRTPTEGGSSGSPVFEQLGWETVALHHAGLPNMEKLDGKGTYPANEGIPINAIREAIRAA